MKLVRVTHTCKRATRAGATLGTVPAIDCTAGRRPRVRRPMRADRLRVDVTALTIQSARGAAAAARADRVGMRRARCTTTSCRSPRASSREERGSALSASCAAGCRGRRERSRSGAAAAATAPAPSCALAIAARRARRARAHGRAPAAAARRSLGRARRASASAGLGARHGAARRPGRARVQLGADRRYTGPDCPPDLLELGGIPQGDYAPVPVAAVERAARRCGVETGGHGAQLRARRSRPRVSARARRRPAAPAPLHRPDAGRAPASLPDADRVAGAAAANGRYGHWKSPRRLRAPGRRARRLPRLPLARHPARRDRDRLARGRPNTTPGSSTRTSSPTPPG